MFALILRDERIMALANKKRVCVNCIHHVDVVNAAINPPPCKRNWYQDQSIHLLLCDKNWAERCPTFEESSGEDHEEESMH